MKRMIVHRAFKFKLDATSEQEQSFRQYAGALRWVYNRMLAERREAFKAGVKAPPTNEQIKQLPALKRQEETAWLNTVHSQVLQDAVLDLDDAFARFFKRQTRYPQFKRKHGKRQSFSYLQGVKVDEDRVWLPKIGWVAFRRAHQAKRYREIVGTIKRATVSHKASGWYVSLLTEQTLEDPQPVPISADNSVGVDLGSIDLVVTSAGVKLANPRHYRTAERRLKREQRKLSRKQRGSHNWHKQKQKVARLHERIANRRLDSLHRLSCQLIRENQAVFCEDLNVLGIARRMGKSVGDAGWGELLRQLEYKAAWAGKTFVQIGRYFPSSKTCSACGYQHRELTLAERRWTCPACDTCLDRDVNAAVNIHREGLKYVAAGRTETQNACGETVRPARRARLREARIPRL
ncbi:MAG: transposase [Anaerolineae bacterium]|nr:transposase [Anaerolineae bacterium]